MEIEESIVLFRMSAGCDMTPRWSVERSLKNVRDSGLVGTKQGEHEQMW